mmetsp:Transcript_5723/g.10330  ORF Transcript_5723/g.10330 Transcript_5723/m.10330 type:complete len:187 (-) Transcript_5723:52-612(-)|eukprot:CAMPEP_0183740880 /NCGR_PEP_ID=MMETSP0737-20130205/60748_1 /TAXON_ID=385413 /ORGANISM="Thalassiosira miniscula, Strain CCMP1093" /LENGTH=186 /DNA_ID=CAMNT_0025976049 /DNA_START=114 /DNA_END=674 /DNA_ORIENTATION=+
MALIVDFPPILHRRLSPCPCGNERRVTFAEDPNVDRIKEFDSSRFENRCDLWSTKHDIVTAKLEIVRLLKALRKEGITLAQYAAVNVDTSFSVGLEKHYSYTSREEILGRRKAVHRAVLSEQERQRAFGIYDSEKMAAVAAHHSEFCRHRARIIGLLHNDERSTRVSLIMALGGTIELRDSEQHVV